MKIGTSKPIETVDSLSLLALKVASNVFDISSSLSHLSIRDQVVRAQMLVRDLKQAEPGLDRLLIVGAGVAGMAAALTARELKITEVLVLDIKPEPFSLLRDVTARHVGPFMYEWPSPFFNDQSYPHHTPAPSFGNASSPLVWKAASPVSAQALAKALDAHVRERFAEVGVPPPTLCVGMDKWRISEFVTRFARTEGARTVARLQKRALPDAASLFYKGSTWPDAGTTSGSFVPQYVVLAAGMGTENLQLIENDSRFVGKSFWSNDDLLDNVTCKHRVAVFGGGDGALQDVLRSLTGHEHPLCFIRHLEAKSAVRRALAEVSPQLLSADRQSRQFSGWTKGHTGFINVDHSCQKIAAVLAKNRHVVYRVLDGLRKMQRTPGSVDHPEVALFVRESYFDKTYLLNRFLVHLIEACMATLSRSRRRSSRAAPAVDRWEDIMMLRVYRGCKAAAYATAGARHVVTIEDLATKAQWTYSADRVVVRYGISKDSIPGGQMIQISAKVSQQRTTLNRVELPFVAHSAPG